MTSLVTAAVVVALFYARGISGFVRNNGGVVPIKADEDAILFPTLSRRPAPVPGNESNDTDWVVPVHGWIYEPEHDSLRRRAFLKLLRRVLDLEKGEEASKILARRVRPFLFDNERGKALTVELLSDVCGIDSIADGDAVAEQQQAANPRLRARMPRSGRDGHFKGQLHISDEDFESCRAGDTCSILLRLVQPADAVAESSSSNSDIASDRVFMGTTYLLPPTGLSVISDVDDTIKLSNVLNKKELLRNTFLKEFEAVPGMSELYQTWSEQLGATFHFVSSSPWQLYRELSNFMEREQFPMGSFHLKQIRAKPSAIQKMLSDPFETKVRTIGNILDAYPGRTFVLVGDTGEKDPEVYGEICRRYPYQVWRVYLRDAGEESSSRRFDLAFEKVPRDVWTIFSDPSEVDLVLPER
mmetsp:Transcript_35535/g.77899  ORF Transcript_35535/g.77899 Transcript_35535/m.77899 type:complete len:413 (+) Transcript_35535:41-1279(+)